MSGLFIPKQRVIPNDSAFGVCIWRFPDGKYLMNNEGDYFCSQGRVGDRAIEARMEEVVKREFGDLPGQPAWLPGFRQISENEWCDQMERLLDGKVPDPADLSYQWENDEHN